MTIRALHEALVYELTKQGNIVAISKELTSINTNDERVLYVYYLLTDLDVFPSCIKAKPKSDVVSIGYRNLGNLCFKKLDDFSAWQYYNLSLMHAPPLSDQYVLALANRSAVFFYMKKFEECLKDIQKVLSVKHPDKIREKLCRRQSACKEALAKESSQNDEDITSEIQNILALKGSKDGKYTCASTKLRVVCSEQMGRHVVAREDIKVGEVLVQEEPYFALLLRDHFVLTCNYCLSRDLNLIPCDNCISVLYCSEICKDKAWQEYHKIECVLMPMLIDLRFTKLELLALRTTIKARTDHQDWLSLINTIRKAEALEDSEHRGCVKIGDKWVFDSKYYASIHTLASNIEKRSISDIFQKCVTAAMFLKLLTAGTDFANCDNDVERESIKRCIAGTLLLHLMTSPTNMHGLSTNSATKDGMFVVESCIASAPYAFHSLINHSCAPNVVRLNKLGARQMMLIALRPIKKGMQLFDNYGSHFAVERLDGRQSTLKSQYKFTCICEACVNNWPVYAELLNEQNVPYPIKERCSRLLTRDAINRLEKGDKGMALELYKPLCDLLEELEPYAPSTEMSDCQESMKQCLLLFGGVVPYDCNLLVDPEKPPA